MRRLSSFTWFKDYLPNMTCTFIVKTFTIIQLQFQQCVCVL